VLEPLWAASDHLCGKPLGPDDPCELMGCAWPQGRQVRAANDGAASQWGVWQGGYGSLGRVFVVLGPSDREAGRLPGVPSRPRSVWASLVPVARRGARDESDVWLLTLVLDAQARSTELRVLDGADIAAPPVATVRLPHAVPFGFHGNWVETA